MSAQFGSVWRCGGGTVTRIVGGRWSGRQLLVPHGSHTRPTGEKVRAALGNALTSGGALAGASVLDLFSGSGALGLELLSRGAAAVVLVDNDRAALAALRANVTALGATEAQIVPGPAAAYPTHPGPRFDVVVADPPYGFTDWSALLARLPADVVVVEAGGRIEAVPEGWELTREKRYGRTFVAQFRRRVP